jgi:hypothetical protein
MEVAEQDKKMKRKGIVDKNERVCMTKTDGTELQLLVDVIIHKTCYVMRALRLEKLIFSKFLKKFLLSWNSNMHFQVRKSQPNCFYSAGLNFLSVL